MGFFLIDFSTIRFHSLSDRERRALGDGTGEICRSQCPHTFRPRTLECCFPSVASEAFRAQYSGDAQSNGKQHGVGVFLSRRRRTRNPFENDWITRAVDIGRTPRRDRRPRRFGRKSYVYTRDTNVADANDVRRLTVGTRAGWVDATVC